VCDVYCVNEVLDDYDFKVSASYFHDRIWENQREILIEDGKGRSRNPLQPSDPRRKPNVLAEEREVDKAGRVAGSNPGYISPACGSYSPVKSRRDKL
jgi:hypothetical protein